MSTVICSVPVANTLQHGGAVPTLPTEAELTKSFLFFNTQNLGLNFFSFSSCKKDQNSLLISNKYEVKKNLLSPYRIHFVFISVRMHTGGNVGWERGKDVFYFWTLQALIHFARSCLMS